MTVRNSLIFTALSAVLVLAACGSSDSGDGGGTGSIKVGSSSSLSGPTGAYGKALIAGQEAIFEAANADGGINGRKIELSVLDDAYDPAKAVQNTRKLLADGALAITGNGFPAVIPFLTKAKVPLVFPPNTQPAWVDEPTPYVFATTPTFRDQSVAAIENAFTEYGPGSVYFVATQSADLDALLGAAEAATKDNGGTWLGSNEVPFGAPDIGPFALQAAEDNPDYIVFGTAPADTTRIVAKLASSDSLPNNKILGVSSLPGSVYLDGAPSDAQSMTISLAGTYPLSDEFAKACTDALAKYKSIDEPDLVNVTGCAEAQMLVSALKSIDGGISSASLVEALNSTTAKEPLP